MPPSENRASKKSRTAAIARLRAHLDARISSEEVWNIIDDYDKRRPSAQTEGRATALVLSAILEQSLETAILTHCISLEEKERLRLFSGGEDGPMNFAVKIRLGLLGNLWGKEPQRSRFNKTHTKCIRSQ